jgi:hypothetical protein
LTVSARENCGQGIAASLQEKLTALGRRLAPTHSRTSSVVTEISTGLQPASPYFLAHFAAISHLVDAEYDPLVPDLKGKLIQPKSIRGWTFIGDSPWPLKEPCFRKLELNAIQFVTETVQSEIRKKAVVLFEDGFELSLAICGIQFGCASFRTRAFSQKWVDLNQLRAEPDRQGN